MEYMENCIYFTPFYCDIDDIPEWQNFGRKFAELKFNLEKKRRSKMT